ncbi:MAG: hypothetical protein Q9167_007713 [Letrouitia subvulpina]
MARRPHKPQTQLRHTLSLNKRTLQEFDRRSNLEDQRRNPLEERPPEGLRVQEVSADLKRFARRGGPDLSSIKGFPEPETMGRTPGRVPKPNGKRKTNAVQGSKNNTTTTKSKKSGRSSAYQSDFMKLLIGDGVDRTQRTRKPANYDDLHNRLVKRRGSLSPTLFSERHYENFLEAAENAVDEAQVMTDVFSVIKGNKSRPSRTNHACKNWAPLISANLVIPQPDFFDGAEQSAADSTLRQVLDAVIVPSTSSDSPFLPNFFAEVKPSKAAADVAYRQALYDGAFGARAMHHLKSYGNDETIDENAYTLTTTYVNNKLEIFAHYITASDNPGRKQHYRTVPIIKKILDEDIEAFRFGVTAFRNARDISEQNRKTFIADANQRMNSVSLEIQEKYKKEALQRIQKIVARNGSFERTVLTSQEDPPEEEDY